MSGLTVVAVVCAFFAVGAAPALGAYGVSGVFATSEFSPGGGSTDGLLLDPGQVDVNDASGRIYVADTGNNRVQVFKPTGIAAEYEAQASIAAPAGLAIDQDNGDVYVANPGGVAKLTSSLSPKGGWSNPGVTGALAVDPSTGDLLVADTEGDLIRRFGSDGTAKGTFAAERPVDVAANSAGEVFVVTTTGDILHGGCEPDSAVIRFSGDGVELGAIGADYETPGAVAVDPDGDEIAIAAEVDKYTCEVNVFVPDVAFYADNGDPIRKVALPGDTMWGEVSGLAVQGGSDRAYAVTKDPFDSAFVRTQAVALEDVTPPAATIDPVDPAEVSATTAILSGGVNPGGLSTSWRFDYREAGAENWSSTTGGNAGAGEAVVPVEAEVTGLDPDTSYEARLVASSEDGEPVAGPVSFATKPGPPTVAPLSPSQVAETNGQIRAAVSANGAETSYFFEFGSADCSGGGCEPLAGSEGTVGAKVKDKTVSFPVSGLQRETTYHYRLIAENGAGTTVGPNQTFTTPGPVPPFEPPVQDPCPNDPIRTAQGSMMLSDCRAYEQVSPVQKYNGGVVFGQRVADDGEAAGFMMNTPISDSGGGFPAEGYVAHRGPNGWTSATSALPMKAENRGTGVITSTAIDYSEDFDYAFVRTNDPIDPADREAYANGEGATDGFDLFRMNMATRGYEWISRPEPSMATNLPAGRVNPGYTYGGRSRDASVIVFSSDRPLVPGAPNVFGLYQRVDGELSMVSRMPDETPTMGFVASGHFAVAPAHGHQGVSDDGRRIYWEEGPNVDLPQPLYLRKDAEETVPVSASRRAEDLGTMRPTIFLGATRDGSHAYFWSAAPLTEDAPGAGVYLYDADADELDFLFGASNLVERYQSLYNPVLSEANERLYFMADSQLTPDAEPGRNLYLWDDGQLEHVAAVSEETINIDPRLRVSRDGRYAAFSTTSSLDPRQPEGVNAIYRYDAETGALDCASCTEDGTGSEDAEFRSRIPRFTLVYLGDLAIPRNIADDGSVFFQTKAALAPRDVNGTVDVYEFDGGAAKLLSSGQGTSGSEVADNSDDGSSVFFLTGDSLTGSDRDGGYPDLYVARVGGGFPEPPAPTPPCRGDACQDGGSSQPAKPSLVTEGGGEGDAKQRPAARKQPRLLDRKQVKGGVRLRLRVPSAGRVGVRGAMVRPAAAKATKGGVLAVRVTLNKRGRDALADRGSLRTGVTLTFAPRSGGRTTQNLTLRFEGGRR